MRSQSLYNEKARFRHRDSDAQSGAIKIAHCTLAATLLIIRECMLSPCVTLWAEPFRVAREERSPPDVAEFEVEHENSLQTWFE